MKSWMSYVVCTVAVVSLSYCKTNTKNNTSEVASVDPSDITDGCYALGTGEVLCLTGLTQEGISGASATVAYGTNTANTKWCGVTTGISNQSGRMTFTFDPASKMKTITFSDKQVTFVETSGRSGTYDLYAAAYVKGSQMFNSPACETAKAKATSGVATNSGGAAENCSQYIKSCPGGRKAVNCENSFRCIEETFGEDFPTCVPKSQLKTSDGRFCSSSAACVKCP